MSDTALDIVVTLLGLHALAKFAFFALPYARRRAALDRGYGDKPSATSTGDAVLLTFTVLLSGLMLWRGVEATSFLGGMWIGATLIQLYFHRFHAPLAPERMPPPAVSPLKMMSYAIQASPWRAWREMLVLAVLIAWMLVAICMRDF